MGHIIVAKVGIAFLLGGALRRSLPRGYPRQLGLSPAGARLN